MLAAGADKHAPAVQSIARLSFLNQERAALIEPTGEHFGETLGHMLHHHDAPREIRRQLRQHILKRLWAAGRNSYGDNSARLPIGGRRHLQTLDWFRQSARDLNSATVCRSLDLCDELLPAFLHARSHIRWLSDKIKGSQRKSLQRDRSALGAMRTNHNHRQPVTAHNFP